MSAGLSPLKPKEVVKILESLGYKRRRQTGSHLILKNPKNNKIVTVPMHNKELKRGTLRTIIRQSGVDVDEFFNLK